jgi:GH15 family glucan-1,4-alpha-glucosidase
MPNKAAQPVLIRRLSGVHGSMRMRLVLALRFDYGLVAPRLRRSTDALLAVAGSDMLALRCPVPVTATNDGLVTAEFDVAAGDELSFVLTHNPSHLAPPPSIDLAQALEDTLAFWRDWASRFQRETPWRDAVMRSLLTLKALSYHPTGALIAAGTTSLPETPGGSDNWDYRYCWLRDATFMLSALLNAGYREEATHWREWLLRAIAAAPNELRIMYRVDGDRRMYEQQAEWLPGYEGAAPVRVGNDAAAQRQIDVAGELLDALDLIARAGVDRTQEALRLERELVEVVERTWQDKGHGLWESRGRPEPYTYSVVMAWAGVDRFLSGSERNPYADQDLLSRLRGLRARIHDEVTERCWNFARGHFVDRYGGERLDASLLLLPLVNFLPADEPRMSATIDAIERELSQDGLVWRTPHGGDTDQGAFIACSCWLADCRALQSRRDQAVVLLGNL